jgi:hypothetical protein
MWFCIHSENLTLIQQIVLEIMGVKILALAGNIPDTVIDTTYGTEAFDRAHEYYTSPKFGNDRSAKL